MDHDQLNNGDGVDIIQKTYSVLSGLQGFLPVRQVQCAALMFLLVCKIHGLDIKDMLRLADRISMEAEKYSIPEFKALKNYIRNEL